MTPVTLRIGRQEVAGELDDGPTANDLLALLPLELPMQDQHRQEKLARLPQALTVRGAPRAAGAAPADIGYYAPSQGLVLYYARVGVFPGIVRVGGFTVDAVDVVRGLEDGTVVTLARA